MASYYYVTSDWKAIVPEGSPDAAFGVQARDLARLGLTAPGDAPEAVQPQVRMSANLLPAEPTPEAKAAPAPANKSARKPETK